MTAKVKNVLTVTEWRDYQRVYDFVGNDVLRPLNETGYISGILPVFWESAPEPDDESGRDALMSLREYARQAHENGSGDPSQPDVPGVLNVEREYQYLFASEPRVITASYHPQEGAPTLSELYAKDGMKMGGESREHDRYLDIQLIYLAYLCGQAADDMIVASDEERDIEQAVLPTAEKTAGFIETFPLSWLGELREQVDAARPGGYFSALFAYVQGLLRHQLGSLSR